MSICSEWLHCFHWEFEAQSNVEKLKWYAYAEAKSIYYEKEDRQRKNEQKTQQMQSKAKNLVKSR